jgi:signal transduction histidine kinase
LTDGFPSVQISHLDLYLQRRILSRSLNAFCSRMPSRKVFRWPKVRSNRVPGNQKLGFPFAYDHDEGDTILNQSFAFWRKIIKSLLYTFLIFIISLLFRLFVIDQRVGSNFAFFPYYPAMIVVTYTWGPGSGFFMMLMAMVAVHLYPRWGPQPLVFVDGVFLILSFISIWIVDKVRRILLSEKQQRKALSDFISMLAHEIKSPLACIYTAASSLSLLSPGELAAGRIKNQKLAVDEILTILDRCIEADRLGSEQIQINPLPIDIFRLLAEVNRQFDCLDRFFVDCPRNLYINSDLIILRRVLHNLIENALRYSPKGSLIHLDVARKWRLGQKGLLLRCANQISSKYRPEPEKIFEKFYRGPDSTSVSGAGLGLWLVKEFVRSLSGSIRCEVDDQHVIFLLWLPHKVK